VNDTLIAVAGEQTRSFTYIDDCLEGTQRLMHSDVTEGIYDEIRRGAASKGARATAG
jgi:nucleoside-diphosphate-sugar epimerase